MSYLPFGTQYYTNEDENIRTNSIFYILFETPNNAMIASQPIIFERMSHIYDMLANIETLIYFFYTEGKQYTHVQQIIKLLVNLLIFSSLIINSQYFLANANVFTTKNSDNVDVIDINNDEMAGMIHEIINETKDTHDFIEMLYADCNLYTDVGGNFSTKMPTTIQQIITSFDKISSYVTYFQAKFFKGAGNKSGEIATAIIYSHFNELYSYKEVGFDRDIFVKDMISIIFTASYADTYFNQIEVYDNYMIALNRNEYKTPDNSIDGEWCDDYIKGISSKVLSCNVLSDVDCWTKKVADEFFTPFMTTDGTYGSPKDQNFDPSLIVDQIQTPYEQISDGFRVLRSIFPYIPQISQTPDLQDAATVLTQIRDHIEELNKQQVIQFGEQYAPLLMQINDQIINKPKDDFAKQVNDHYKAEDQENVKIEANIVEEAIRQINTMGGGYFRIKHKNNKKTKKNNKKIIKKYRTKNNKKYNKKNRTKNKKNK